MIPYSILDLSPIPEGFGPDEALRRSLDLARHAEGWGYKRYWLAEHHNMPGIASSATAVLIGQIAAETSTIRVGSGGIMLPNHAPLVVAEQFGTLATLFPGRIDLGLGRAPGTDGRTMRALRRGMAEDRFVEDVIELMMYLGDPDPDALVRAVPGAGTHVPVWILGSSLFGAQLAAHLGLPYAFASHFAPAALEMAFATYRERFQPSAALDKPCAMLAVNVFAADEPDAGQRLRTSSMQSFARLRSGNPGPLPPPVDDIEALLSPPVLESVGEALSVSAVGTPAEVKADLERLIARHRPDEVILAGHIWDHAARLRSFEIAAEVMRGM
jgi:luciferase family oxidoreductase group 1